MSVITIAALILILLALGFVAMGAVNLYSDDPRGKGMQLGLLLVSLVLVGVAYVEVGIGAAVLLFAIVVVAQLLYVLRRRGTA
jgi:hypothetical protein